MRLNAYVAGVFLFQIVICLLMACLARDYDQLWEILGWNHLGESSIVNRILFDFFTW